MDDREPMSLNHIDGMNLPSRWRKPEAACQGTGCAGFGNRRIGFAEVTRLFRNLFADLGLPPLKASESRDTGSKIRSLRSLLDVAEGLFAVAVLDHTVGILPSYHSAAA